MINKQILEELNPCRNRWENYLKHYSDFNGSYEDFLKLENISYDDKIWVAVKLFDCKILQQWSLDCAEFVADNFNKEFPNDNRINECIEAIKKVLSGELSHGAARSAAGAAWSAASSAARSAALSVESAATQEDINISLLIALVSDDI